MTTARRVLITGAGGFVGGALARGFAELGWEVIGVDRSFSATPDDERIRQISCTLAEDVPDELRSVGVLDLIVHGAWITTDPDTLGVSAETYAGLNLKPLHGALALARTAKPKAFVFLSSSGVFQAGDAPDGAGLTDADDPTGRSLYGRLKLEAEDLVLRELSDGALAGHVVRLGYLYGPHEAARDSRQGVSLVTRWIAAARAGDSLEVRADDPVREWTSAPDLAGALERLVMGSPAGRALHLGSPHVYHDSEVAGVIAEALPGIAIVEAPAGPPVKPPMLPSDIDELQDFAWTDVPTGLSRILGRTGALTP